MYKRTRPAGKTGQRQRWNEERARAVLSELEATGQSVAEFARRKAVSVQRLFYWRKRLGKATTTQFVAVTLPRATTLQPAQAATSGRIEIAVSGTVIRVREELDVEYVGRLVEAIARRMGEPC